MRSRGTTFAVISTVATTTFLATLAAWAQTAAPSKLPPATVKLPEKAEIDPATKAALLAINARGGNGFRLPPAKPKTAKPNPARPPKRRRNRGPPK